MRGSSAASNPALTAPGSPIASVPTGTPAGICTIEWSKSWPCNAVVEIGTPSTGRVVKAAVMPGRCAAPPAPATITLKPASRADFAKAYRRSGVRCAETMRASKATPSSSRTAAAALMTGQSDWLPMMIATGGDSFVMIDYNHEIDPAGSSETDATRFAHAFLDSSSGLYAMISGRSWSSRRVILSLRLSLRFFRRVSRS